MSQNDKSIITRIETFELVVNLKTFELVLSFTSENSLDNYVLYCVWFEGGFCAYYVRYFADKYSGQIRSNSVRSNSNAETGIFILKLSISKG